MNKLFTFFTVSFLAAACIFADPQYYNYNNGTSYNSFPFNQAAGKRIQLYIAPGEFTTPTPAPNGNITKFSVRISTGYPLNSMTYTNFRLIFADTTLSGNTMEAGWYLHPNEDTVFYRASLGPINAPADTWLDFTLDHPHPYNNSKGLVIAIEQTAASGSSLNQFSLQHTATPTYRRHYSVGGAPFTYSGRSLYVPNCGIDVAAANPFVPNYLYYKFENNPNATTVLNCAVPGVGTATAPLGTGTPLTTGGQFDTCISGTGLSTGGVTTGWNCNLGTSSWTISMWITIPTTSSGSAYYLFGDAGAGSFRCFHNGVALPNNLVLRGAIPDVTVTGIGPAPTVVTFVRDSVAGQIRAYKNGVLANTVATTVSIGPGTGFKVGGYGSSTSFVGKFDEFRLWSRALSPAEVTAMWNSDPGGCGILAINENNNQIPNQYTLEQNYPNPFNPSTTIGFGIPKAGNVKLTIYDLLGREVSVLTNAFYKAGSHSIQFNASNLASGVYVYKIEAGDFVTSKKMTLVK